MRIAPLPENEKQRKQTLSSYDILDTKPEAEFDSMVQLASAICDTPISAISLIDTDRQWFKSIVGLDAKETSRDLAFCAHAILEDDIMIVQDALKDERFFDNALVCCDPKIRFYAGAQLITKEGSAIGTLCVIDRKPRELTANQLMALKVLANQIVSQLELRRSRKDEQRLVRALRLLSKSNELLLRAEKEQEFLKQVCVLAVEAGGYMMAWVGLANNDLAKTVRPVAQSGYEEGYLDNICVSWGDAASGLGPTGTAIRTGVTFVNQDFQNNPLMTPWLKAANKLGYQASIALPLIVNQVAIGALTIYSSEHDAFLDEEVKLLEELAGNLAYGIRALRIRVEHERAQNALKIESEMNLALLRNASDGIHILDYDGNIVELSDSFCAMLGYRRDEMTGMNVSRWDAGSKNADELQGLFRQVFDKAVRIQFETLHRRKDGSVFDVEISVFPLQMNGISLLYCSSRNIVERKLIEGELRRSEQRLRTIIETEPECIKLVDTSGRLLEMNAAGLAMLEATSLEEAQQHALLSYIDPACRAEFVSLHHRVMNGESGKMEFKIKGLRGTIRFLETHAAPMRDSRGNIEFLLGITRDITYRKHAEAEQARLQSQLLQAQKMESIGHLTGGIAHDFNNLLGAMLGYAELLGIGRANEAPLPARMQNYIAQILAAGNRAKELISQMLIFSRLNAVEASAVASPMLLQPMIKEVMHLLRSSIPSTINVTCQVVDEHLQVRIQAVQLHQILMNLVINARDAVGEYGRIDVRADTDHLSGFCDACHDNFSGNYVDITVSDTGSGIPEHLLTKIFDPFFTTKEVGKGTGMGLPVVHGIVHALQGHITLVSGETGTSIHILLPAAEAVALNMTDKMQSPEIIDDVLSGYSIMVVDDEQAMVLMLEEFLGMHGAQVFPFFSSTEALAAFGRNPGRFDLVITDETMPSLSGLDMVKSMLKLRPELPVLLCTGYSEYVNQGIAQQGGIAGFMYKPVDLAKMLQWICDLRIDVLKNK